MECDIDLAGMNSLCALMPFGSIDVHRLSDFMCLLIDLGRLVFEPFRFDFGLIPPFTLRILRWALVG